MGSLMVFMLLAMSQGGGMSPQLIQMIIAQQKESFRKWKVLIQNGQQLIVTGIFYLRGPAVVQDPKAPSGAGAGVVGLPQGTGGGTGTSNAAIAAQISLFQQDFLTQTVVGKLLDTIVNSLLEFLEPSDAQQALMTALMSGGLGGGGGFGGAAPASTNVIINQAPPTGPRSAGQVLQGGPRAQAMDPQALLTGLMNGYLKSVNMTPDSPVPPGQEQQFYGNYIAYVWKNRAGNLAMPPMDSLMGGYLQSLNLGPNSPIPPDQEATFYNNFVLWVFNAAAGAPTPPPKLTAGPGSSRPTNRGGGHF